MGSYQMVKAYEEIIDFIAVIHREKTDSISQEEKNELDHYLELEHIIRLAKARARQRIANG